MPGLFELLKICLKIFYICAYKFRFFRFPFEIAENIGNSWSRSITFFGFVVNSVFVSLLVETCSFFMMTRKSFVLN